MRDTVAGSSTRARAMAASPPDGRLGGAGRVGLDAPDPSDRRVAGSAGTVDHLAAALAGAPMQALLVYAAGGPLTADIEETCRRLRLPVAGLVRNRPGDCVVLDAALLVDHDALGAEHRRHPFLCPLFTPANRRLAEALALGLRAAPALVDPSAIVAASTAIGAGSFVNAGCTIGAAGRIGTFVIVNRATSLGHHAEIGDFAAIGPGVVVAGQVTIGSGALLGAGAVVAPGSRIGAGCRVAPGTVVNRDLPEGSLAAGNPMRILGPAGRDTAPG